MESIKRALLISILSRGWAAAMALVAVPFYLDFLGIESYGVVGLFTSFSILVGFLDLGLGATLTRELARAAQPEDLPATRDLTRTFELVYGLLAVLIGLSVMACATPVAQHWVQVQSLDRIQVAQALALAGVALACQWPTNLYSSGLAGCHRQTQLGVVTMVFATLRVGLTLLALKWEPTLEKFFFAQIAASLLQSWALRSALWRVLELNSHRPTVRIDVIRVCLRFAGGMTGIMITSIVLTQTDKVILSKALTLADFGIYVVAGTLATGLYILISPMFSVMYPRFSALVEEKDAAKISSLYHVSSQTMAALVIPVAAILAGFAQEVLYLWTGNQHLSQRGAPILALMIIGSACNGIMNIPYALQLASGWTRLSLVVNLGAIAVLAPTMWWAATHYGAVGGAAVWALLNIGYVVLTPQIMHRRLLPQDKIGWYGADVLLPTLAAMVVLVVLRQIPLAGVSRITMVLTMICYWALVAIATILVLPRCRERAILWFSARVTHW